MRNSLNSQTAKPFVKARRRVKELKRLYTNIAMFIPISILVMLGEPAIMHKLADTGVTNHGILDWVSWNIRFIPLVWLLVILIQGICIYARHIKQDFRLKKPRFLKHWEERQLDKFLNEENAFPSDIPEA